jgi:hypothetical protein
MIKMVANMNGKSKKKLLLVLTFLIPVTVIHLCTALRFEPHRVTAPAPPNDAAPAPQHWIFFLYN